MAISSRNHGDKPGNIPAKIEPAHLLNSNFAAANGYWRNVVICLGRKSPTAVEAKDYLAAIEYVIANSEGPIGIITVIQEASTPTPEGRDALIRAFREMWPRITCAAFVIQGRGFSAAAQRAILSGFTMITGLNSRMRIVNTIEAATSWMASLLVPSAAGTDENVVTQILAQVVKDFCDTHDHD